MELATGARSVLRLLLTLLMLYSHIAAGQAPGSDMGTLMDDEDVNIGEGKTGVQFTVELLSEVDLTKGCSDTNLLDAIKTQVRSELVTAIGEDCKCGPSESIIDTDSEKIGCKDEDGQFVQYSGQISEWTSTTYTIKQLSEFINSWRAVIEVNRTEILKIMFNVTNSPSSIEEFGSGDGMGNPGVNNEIGSGEIVTIEVNIPGGEEEDIKGPGNVGGLDGVSGELRVQVVGYIITLCTAFAIFFSFA